METDFHGCSCFYDTTDPSLPKISQNAGFIWPVVPPIFHCTVKCGSEKTVFSHIYRSELTAMLLLYRNQAANTVQIS